MKRTLLCFAILSLCLSIAKSQHPLDAYLNSSVSFKVINGVGDSIYLPKDLDFKPGTYELWVLCRNKGGGGMGTVTFYDAGQPGQKAEFRQDSRHSHFLRGSLGLAWGTNGNFATVQCMDVSSKDWMGPTLWPGDTSIYARVHQNDGMLGSHLDMIHQTTTGRGIAYEKDNVYWIYDDFTGDICRYDFMEPHEPGGDDHSDGKVRRYAQVQVSGETGVPSHMIIDTVAGRLYIADTGNDRVLKLDINSGEVNQPLSPYAGEELVEYVSMKNVQWESYITGLTQPAGIEYYQGRLLVGDYTTGEIIIYNTTGSGPLEMGRIQTGSPGMMGLKVGPDERIWYVNNTQNQVVRIDPSPDGLNSYKNEEITVYPNPSAGLVKIACSGEKVYRMEIFNVQGQLVYAEDYARNGYTLESALPSGMYTARFKNNDGISTRKLMISR